MGERLIVYKYWLLQVLWLKLWLPRWSPKRSIFPRRRWSPKHSVFPRRSRGKIKRSGDHRGSQSFNYCTSKSSQYLFYNTPNISKYCTIKLQTWLLQSTDDRNVQIVKTFTVLHVVSWNPKWLQTINLSSSDTQRTSGYCTLWDIFWTSTRQTDALS